MLVKGTLIAIGGNEDKGTGRPPLHVPDAPQHFLESGILFRIASETRHPDAPIEIVTTASSIPEKVGRSYVRAFARLGRRRVQALHLTSPEEADHPDTLERVSAAGCVLFSGGDQLKLLSVFRNTTFVHTLHERYLREPVVIAGTSAGAMALSDLMIYPAESEKTGVDLHEGLALVQQTIIDTHFMVRGRFRRLAIAVARHPTHLGIGLEEDTGIVIRQGNQLETIGSGLVTIIDGRRQHDPNQTVARTEHDIFIENLLVHVLSQGNHFRLRSMKIG